MSNKYLTKATCNDCFYTVQRSLWISVNMWKACPAFHKKCPLQIIIFLNKFNKVSRCMIRYHIKMKACFLHGVNFLSFVLSLTLYTAFKNVTCTLHTLHCCINAATYQTYKKDKLLIVPVFCSSFFSYLSLSQLGFFPHSLKILGYSWMQSSHLQQVGACVKRPCCNWGDFYSVWCCAILPLWIQNNKYNSNIMSDKRGQQKTTGLY